MAGFGILGSVEVEGEAGPVAVRGARRRTLLVRLLISANQPVPVERLANEVWNAEPPPGAASTLASHVSLLRAVLDRDRIEKHAGGYRLRVEPGELDAALFESDVSVGQRALRAHEPRRAAAHFRQGLDRWRGPALADVDGYWWARGEITRLEEMRLGVEEQLLDARLVLGEHHEVIAAAEAAVSQQPLREQRWSSLMLALYRSGRQADALRAFQRLRALLDEELGIEPSREVAALEEAIILQRPDLDWTDHEHRAGKPRPPAVTGPGTGAVASATVRSGDLVPASEAAVAMRQGEDLTEDVGAVPLPEPLGSPGPAFFGRTSEQARLSDLFASVALTGRQVVLLGGEPGIGKTALVARVARAVHAGGGAVLHGRCLEDIGAPYHPFIEALSHYVRHAGRKELEAHVSDFGGEVVRLVPSLARRLPDLPRPSSSDPDTERFLAFRSAVGLLADASRYRPVLLVLDDLHWADPASVQLFRHLARSAGSARLLVLATFRTSEVAPGHPVADALAALWHEEGVTRMELGGLVRDDVAELCTAMTGIASDVAARAALVDDLTEDTGGNPFFLGELLRHLGESGDLDGLATEPRLPDGIRSRTALPRSLREVIGQRIRRLGAKAERMLSLAAIVGVEFDASILSRVAGVDQEAVLDMLESASRAALLDEVEGHATFVFSHALIRHALFDALGPARRRQLHAKVASVLERGDGETVPSSLLAYHYSAAGERQDALRCAERAGLDALEAMAPEEAVRWLGEARALLEELDPGDGLRLSDVVTRLGVAQRLAGNVAYRETLLDAVALADAAGDARRIAEAALANTRGFYSAVGQTDGDRLATLRLAVSRLGSADSRLRARLLATLCSEMVFGSTLDERRAVASEAKEQAVRAPVDPFTVVDVHNMASEALRHPSTLTERLSDTATAIRVAEELEDPAALFWAAAHRMRAGLEAGMVTEAAEHFSRMTAVSDVLGQPLIRWMTDFSGAMWHFIRGETAAGELLAEEALALGTTIGQPDAFTCYVTQISHARWQQGRLAELVETIAAGAEENPGIPTYCGALARALCHADRGDEARALLDQAVSRRFADLPENFLWSSGVSTFAESAIVLGHEPAAEMLYGLLAPFGDQFMSLGTTCEGPVAHFLGGLATVLGRFAEAEDHLRDAARLADAAGSPFFAVRTTIEQGRLAARQGDPAHRHLLEEGRRQADAWGFAGESRRAERALVDLG